jgi:hypothetical protein
MVGITPFRLCYTDINPLKGMSGGWFLRIENTGHISDWWLKESVPEKM